eukprot:gnl/TRDRNA2_/TRDRNA2_163150_c0_seq3.p1 gnl/TRDRNA2_/TRDRNA2_163150_c0~~gnl/TRDRNA2_/TRDRNA2_163150_c0_seq3.p1  ORF type:complete len:431 (+),score=87.59 gnl/TRDRNA2_/TRDRNA2_163150_c0_seq3:43-1293(+)
MLGVNFFEVSLFWVEFAPHALAVTVVLGTLCKGKVRWGFFLSTPLFIITVLSSVIAGSWIDAYVKGFDLSNPSMRQAVESYVQTGSPDLEEIMELKKYPEVFGYYEIRNLFRDLFRQALVHSLSENAVQMPVAYNKGDDWFEHTLGKAMVYTGAIYDDDNTSLFDAQLTKLDHVAKSINIKSGEQLLDVGCGWGRLLDHMSTKYGANVTGITLSGDQKAYAEKNIIKKPEKARIVLNDFWTWDVPEHSFDKITSLEMFEHVGIKYYTAGLRRLHSLLKDDGVLYFQVAGLRPCFEWRDFLWGMYMNEHVFPGADASTPLYWVTNHLERAGFEVQRVHNMGSHYSRTLNDWLTNWREGKESIVSKYGIVAWRRWEVFLRWSVQAALEGSSTVMMITATKYGQVDTRVRVQDHIKPQY